MDAGDDAGGRAGVVFVAALVAVLATYLVLLTTVPNSFIGDDTDQIVFAQGLFGGYHEQPPLYSWLTWLSCRTFGPTRFALGLLKTLVLGSIYVALYRLARLILDDGRHAALAAGAVVLIPTFSWNSAAYLTHSNLACALGVASVSAVVRVGRGGRWRDYAWLGVCLGLGTLSKYNYLVFAGALLAAGLTSAAYRPRLLDRRMLLALGIALVVVWPHARWVIGHWETIVRLGALKARLAAGTRPVGGGAYGAARLAANLVLVLAPLAAVMVRCAPGAFRPVLPTAGPVADVNRLLGRTFVFALGMGLTLIAATGAAHVHERWLQPFAILMPVYLFGRLSLRPPAASRLGELAVAQGVAVVLVLGAWVVQTGWGVHGFGGYQPTVSFREAAERLAVEAGGGNTVVSADRTIAANFAYWLRGLRHACASHLLFLPPGELRGDCVVVWNVSEGPREPPPYVRRFTSERLALTRPDSAQARYLDVRDRATGRVAARLAYLVLPGDLRLSPAPPAAPGTTGTAGRARPRRRAA